MKLADLFEMTWRSGSDMSSMPFPKFEDFPLAFEGKMQHGHEVYSFDWSGTKIYGVKIANQFASFTQLRTFEVPGLGQLYESLNSKTKPQFAGQMLSYKLRFFLTQHLGHSIVLGAVHSVATERALDKVSRHFKLAMLNIETGSMEDWSQEAYERLTDAINVTPWRVLFIGATKPLKETSILDWDIEARHLWTYGDIFRELK